MAGTITTLYWCLLETGQRLLEHVSQNPGIY